MKFRQPYIFLGAAVCIIAVAARGVWLQFPLIAPIRGLEWRGADPVWIKNFLAAPFLILFAFALIALLANRKRIGEILLASALVALFSVPVLIWLLDTALMTAYLENSIQYEKIRFITVFLGKVPSSSANPYPIDAGNFQYLTGRASLALKMLGWGWMICVIGAIAVAVLLKRIGKGPSLRKLAVYFAIGMVPILLSGVDTFRADLNYRAGDQRLGTGEYKKALNAYFRAFDLDPMLRNSQLFLNNVSKAHYQLGDTNNPLSHLYVAGISSSKLDRFNALLMADTAADDGTALGLAISNSASRAKVDWLIKQALIAHRNGEVSLAAVNLRRALSINQNCRQARYFLAWTLAHLREFDEADRHLQVLLSSVEDKSIRAIIYNSLGDTHSAAGHADVAREYYALSYSLDKSGNLWAMKGLGGT